MLDHRTALARIPAEVTQKLTQRHTGRGLIHLAAHLSMIGTAGTIIALGLPFWWAVLPVHGILLTFLFTLEHECTHQTPFASPVLCDWVGRACGLVLILPFTWFRYFHLAHHRHTNDPDHDPELASGGPPDTWPAYALHLTGWRYWAGMIRQLVTNAAGRARAPYLPASAAPRITSEARWMLALYAAALSTLFWSPLIFWLWIVPMLLGQPFLRLYLLAEHGRCAFVSNMLENTRTTYTNRAVRFIAWNMPFHAEHHAAPRVPFHQLPALHDHLKAHLQQTAPGYAAYTRASLKSLRG